MFRVTPIIGSSRNILYRCRTLEIRVANLSLTPSPCKSYSQVQERETCPPRPPPPPEPKDNRLKIGAFLLAALTGYFTVYAKKSPEVRDWLSIHAPWFDDFIAIAYQENMTYEEFARKTLVQIKDYISEKPRPRQCSSDGEPVPPCETPKDEKPPVKCKDEEPKKVVKDVPETPCVTKNICELEACMKDLGFTALNNYLTARDACRYYNELVDETMQNFTMQRLKELREAMKERIELVKEHSANGDEASTSLDALARYLDCGISGAPKEALENTKALLREFQAKIKTMQAEYLWDNDRAGAMDDRWQNVETAVAGYISENETMFPTVKYDSPKPYLQDDGDLLLIHTLKHERKLRRILDETAVGMTERVNRGLETLPQGLKDRVAREALISATYKKRQAELDKWYKKRLDDLKAANDKTLKDALKKQLERHEETMKAKLKQKEEEVAVNLNKMVADAVAAQKKNFARDLADMSMKLKIVENKLGERLKAEREARRSQELWTAGASLLAATKKGDPKVRVDKELNALEKAGGEDKLVTTVLKSIPDNVRTEGLVPESILRERYHQMEKVALRVALVEQEGASLPVYVMSYLQSLLLFMKLSGIPQADIDKPIRENMDDLDTFDLLQRARYWVEQGNIAAAVRYVGSLEGASRAAAATWHKDAQSCLEIRQAAEAVLAHAAALGLQYI